MISCEKKKYHLLKVRNLYKLYIKKIRDILPSKNEVSSKALTMRKIPKIQPVFYTMSYNTGGHH